MPPEGEPVRGLESWLQQNAHRRLCIVGVGNPLRGDDGVGSWIARRLAPRVPTLVVEAGVAPENYLEKIAQARPDVVLVLDAADLGGPPGETRWVAAAEAVGGGLSTHALSLELFARYLELRAGAEVFLLAIQPGAVGWGEQLSAPVAAAAERVAARLEAVLGEGGGR